ncbi:heat shock protein [Echinococcus multilocularis]|uniref:Heat shock protein n=1 Tax=Echinococcus multilocularis TaxID=6211 RepID=A0A068Y421_ECHMU|nr:heat shock protein [Echinococcus multilocularis]
MPDATAADNPTEQNVETFAFQADTAQLINLIISGFYSKKDIFLRELISNASTALDRIHYNFLTEPSALDTNQELCIRIIPNIADGTLTIIDTGIGMTKDEMVKNLGTVAHSGAKIPIGASKDDAGVEIIGHFGLGLYSAYLVANKVQVISKSNDDEQYMWESSGNGSFIIRPCSEEPLSRGTKVILYMKEDQSDYLKPYIIKEIVCKYSGFTTYPIRLTPGRKFIWSVIDLKEWNEDNEIPTEVVLNKTEPLWMRSPGDITPEEYSKFYLQLSLDFEDHLAVTHFSAENEVVFRALLFVPKHIPIDYFAKNGRLHNVKLYAKRVLVTDRCKNLIPEYLNFIFGVVDVENLPLNIGRESIQQDNILQRIREILVEKSIELVEEMSKDPVNYMTLHEQFSKSIKLGVYEDNENRYKLANLLRYYSSKSHDQMTDLKGYVSRMKEGQNDIYYIIGESLESVTDSAFIEELKKRDLEVLFMTDPMDEFVMNGMTEYLGKRLVCASSLDLELLEDKEKERFAQVMAEFEPTCAAMKEILGDKVESVIVSNRLVASPSCIVTSTSGWSANMHRIQRAQTLENPNLVLNNCVKKYLEINPNDPIILRLKEMISTGSKPIKVCGDVLNMLYNTALLNSGFSLEKPRPHTKMIYRLIRKCVQIAVSETAMDEGKVTASSDNAVPTVDGDDCGAMDTIS